MSKNIYGIHEYNQEWANWLGDKQAWSLELTELSSNFDGRDFTGFKNVTPIVRLNWGYGSTGTIPSPNDYDEFAYRSAHFVANSKGVQRFHIGNELSLQWEWANGKMPTIEQYVECYHMTYDAIKSVAPDAMVTFAPPAPWNPTFYGDWVDLITLLCDKIGHDKIDFIAIHAYTKGYELDKFDVLQPMDPPYQHRNFSFAVLYEQMNAIPKDMRHLEVHITEANGDGEWRHNTSGRWVQEFYKRIDDWNKNPSNQKILSGILFRWNDGDDKWTLSKDGRTKDDFRAALNHNYAHNYNPSKPPIDISPVKVGKLVDDSNKSQKEQQKLPQVPYVNAEAGLNLRRTINGEVIEALPFHTELIVRVEADGWLNVSTKDRKKQGWVSAQFVTR